MLRASPAMRQLPPQRPASQHDLLRAVDGLVAAGLTPDAVDRRLGLQPGLDHERRAALWLYASARAGRRLPQAARRAAGA
jgi:hypothetical protein